MFERFPGGRFPFPTLLQAVVCPENKRLKDELGAYITSVVLASEPKRTKYSWETEGGSDLTPRGG